MAERRGADAVTFDLRVTALYGDPEMTTGGLQFGLALAWVMYHDPSMSGEAWTVTDVAALAVKIGNQEARRQWVIRILRADVPRYRVPNSPRRCRALTGNGRACDTNFTHGFHYIAWSWVDGTATVHDYCPRHRENGIHARAEYLRTVTGFRKARPTPAANSGGVLARHFPTVDWNIIYRWVSPGWKPTGPPPERSDVPHLTLVTGDGETGDEIRIRPALVVVLNQKEHWV